MTVRVLQVVGLVATLWIAWFTWQLRPASYPHWTTAELEVIESLSLRSLPALPADPSNVVADDPAAAALGEKLFNDPRLSANGMISCATCHQPIRNFTDGLPKGQALGTVARNTPSIVGMAYSPWQFWDGRSDSLWAQALAPLEDENEHGMNRAQVVEVINGDTTYRAAFAALFGRQDTTDRQFANVGKVIAAFERTLLPQATPFDHYVDAVLEGDAGSEFLSAEEAQGLQLFIGSANCTQCHNGPLLTNHEFHNTGVISAPGETPDAGRAEGVDIVLSDPFNCFGEFSDDEHRRCAELEFVRTGADLLGAFKTPSLRNLENTQPFMHKGQLATLAEVLAHYNEAPDAMIGHNEAKPLGLSQRELDHLEAFLLSLGAK